MNTSRENTRRDREVMHVSSPPTTRPCAWWGGVGGGGSIIWFPLAASLLRHPPPPTPKSELRSSRPHRFAGGGERPLPSRASCPLHKFRKSLPIIRMPARQRGAVFDDVAGGPQNPPLIEPPRHVVVRTEDIKVAGAGAFDHEVDGLLCRPGRGRLLGAALRREAGEDEPGNEQMRADLAAGGVSQLVLQRFGKSLHAGLGDVVGGVAGRGGGALLRAGVDDEAGT